MGIEIANLEPRISWKTRAKLESLEKATLHSSGNKQCFWKQKGSSGFALKKQKNLILAKNYSFFKKKKSRKTLNYKDKWVNQHEFSQKKRPQMSTIRQEFNFFPQLSTPEKSQRGYYKGLKRKSYKARILHSLPFLCEAAEVNSYTDSWPILLVHSLPLCLEHHCAWFQGSIVNHVLKILCGKFQK